MKTWEIYKEECENIAQQGIKILGWVGEWKGSLTLLHCHCNQHGEWKSTTISSFKRGCSCPKCKASALGKRSRLDDKLLIQRFENSQYYPTGTVFSRGIKDKQWYYFCPICAKDEYTKVGLCSGIFKTTTEKLSEGRLSCRCSLTYRWTDAQWMYRINQRLEELGYSFLEIDKPIRSRSRLTYVCPRHGTKYVSVNDLMSGRSCGECAGQQQRLFYINIVHEGNMIRGIKFGITANLHRRITEQNRHNQLRMQRIITVLFDNVEDCKSAEKACKSRLECGTIDNIEMQDGWTETTCLQNLVPVLMIIKEHKGEIIWV